MKCDSYILVITLIGILKIDAKCRFLRPNSVKLRPNLLSRTLHKIADVFMPSAMTKPGRNFLLNKYQPQR